MLRRAPGQALMHPWSAWFNFTANPYRPLLPPQKPKTGRPAADHRTVPNGILWIPRTLLGPLRIKKARENLR